MVKLLLLLCISSQAFGKPILGKLYEKDNNKEYIAGNYSIENTSSGIYTIKINTAGNTVSFIAKGTDTSLNFTNKQFLQNKFLPELNHNYYWTVSIKSSEPNIYCYTESFLRGPKLNYRLSPKTFTFYSK